MKKLEEFKENQIDVKSFFGGGNTVKTYQQTGVDGDCCYERSDWFADTNGNGTQDSNEICQASIWQWVCY
jgi:hypothetical protein